MTFSKKKRELAIKLYDINAVKFGDFLTKVGLKTPIYFDLRVIVSYPEIMDLVTSLLYEFHIKDTQCDHLCGVPYTALPICTLLSVMSKKPMLMRRKEAKSYGTKKMIEGHYKKGQTCLIIEDVVTSGSSVMETVKDMRKEGLIADEAVVILDREQGGSDILKENNVRMKSLLTLTQLLDILLENNKITKETAIEVKNYIKETKVPTMNYTVDRTKITYEKRSEYSSNAVAKQLFNIMVIKETNLCLSVDMTSSVDILKLLESVGEHICMVKTHVDIIEDYTENFVTSLKELSKRFNFLIMEDRKYSDIGNTTYLQYTKGLYKVCNWADLVTAHSISGEGVLKALTGIGKGIFLVAEMSSENNLITPGYTEATVKMALKYPDLVTGLVCQSKDTIGDPGLIQLTPGVQLETSEDDLGQLYNTPEAIIIEKGADIAVVGRGIVMAKNPVDQVLLYKKILWECYLKRISI